MLLRVVEAPESAVYDRPASVPAPAAFSFRSALSHLRFRPPDDVPRDGRLLGTHRQREAAFRALCAHLARGGGGGRAIPLPSGRQVRQPFPGPPDLRRPRRRWGRCWHRLLRLREHVACGPAAHPCRRDSAADPLGRRAGCPGLHTGAALWQPFPLRECRAVARRGSGAGPHCGTAAGAVAWLGGEGRTGSGGGECGQRPHRAAEGGRARCEQFRRLRGARACLRQAGVVRRGPTRL